MSDQNSLLPAIAPASGGALTPATGPQRIATRMAENLLGVARSQERALAAQKRYRIGDYEFREADHAQIQRWARRLGIDAEAVAQGLANNNRTGQLSLFDGDFLVVDDGAIVSLVWDFALFPLTDWDWVSDLEIACLSILHAPDGQLPALPRCLSKLICDKNQLTELDLTPVPGLHTLSCSYNELTALDLTPVAGLKTLDCWWNRLTSLDLTPIPGLQTLSCGSNLLTSLDLTPVPGLQTLVCYDNQLTELDLTPVPDLQKLSCGNSQLTKLDLTPVPGLQTLDFWSAKLTEIDLTPVPKLQTLVCGYNRLTALDLTPVPGLQTLYCQFNQLTELDLTPVQGLQKLYCHASQKITGAPPNLEVFRS